MGSTDLLTRPITGRPVGKSVDPPV